MRHISSKIGVKIENATKLRCGGCYVFRIIQRSGGSDGFFSHYNSQNDAV
jgi:hypothetical protein